MSEKKNCENYSRNELTEYILHKYSLMKKMCVIKWKKYP